MGVEEQRKQRRDLLLRVLEACPDPEQALAVAVRMEQFIIDGQTSRERPQEVPLPEEQPASVGQRKICNRVRWTGEDDAHLRQLWQGNQSVEKVAQEFHRTPASIYARVRLLELTSSRGDTKNGKKNYGKRKNGGATPDKLSPSVNSEEIAGPETVGIESVVHFLRTRDYAVVPTEDGTPAAHQPRWILSTNCGSLASSPLPNSTRAPQAPHLMNSQSVQKGWPKQGKLMPFESERGGEQDTVDTTKADGDFE